MHDLVIFDCDGVLVDSEPLSNQVLVDNLSRYGLKLTVTESLGLFLGGTMAGVHEKARQMGADLPDDWVDQIYAEIYEGLRKGVAVMPGVPQLLDTLDDRAIPACVASNGSPEKMQITLGQNGLWERFSNMVFSAHVLGTAKPDPKMFQIAAQHFGASQAVVIEDSASGVTAAARANMRCLAYAPEGGGEKLADLGAEVFTDMAEVPRLLGI
ncbi:haloacid dehalogenase [Ruegeria sp. ANG-S4]|uniref:HAD family hydrolase n=1 Tax=Ruegeria sp. ANG-S4 TaxID=1577904 RepID=UPI00057E0A29|nr:HAD family phosphatase [Ruegeria sp. ANG-S4]KIC45109.1 haloacid dehalogenase [Ruegeria sp. ANG-S4]